MKRLFCVPLLLLCLATTGRAEERILSFQSSLLILTDGSMQVAETIRVRAEQNRIRHGIYRDFPTDYLDRFGNRYRVDFEVLGVSRDGAADGWHTSAEGKGVRVYMGRKDYLLPAGEYSYALTYRTNRQLGFFDRHDELYWNVTGNDWDFPIDAVEARVRLPESVRAQDIVTEAYTGRYGAQGRDYQASVSDNGEARFTTTRPLLSGEGLSIVVSWPKGHVVAPTRQQQTAAMLSDNSSWIIGLFGCALLIVYYTLAWILVGRDPDKGVIITRYAPPPGLTPAAARYVREMGYDHKTFAAALVNLAVKGLVEIEEDADGDYSLIRTGTQALALAPGEKALLKSLFGNKLSHSLKLERANHKQIRKALDAHENALRANSEKLYFMTNRAWLLPGVLLSLLTLGTMFFFLPDDVPMEAGIFLMIWLTFWSFGVFFLGKKVWHAWRTAHSGLKVVGALMISLFALPFFGGEMAGIWILANQASPSIPTLLLSMVALHLLFHFLLKAPTRAGRQLLDQVEGFRTYLNVAEREEMNFRNPPEKTPTLFERYLPFALALGVEQHWMERFAGLFQRLEAGDGAAYRPGWYHGHHWHSHDPSQFSNALGRSLSSALASSSTAPGSSSGSGGGGFSGGGGGGGGGGGW